MPDEARAPKCKAMDDYAALLVKIGEHEGAIAAAKQEIHSIPARMARELKTHQERLQAAHFLYWFTDINVSDIAAGLLSCEINGWPADRFVEMIGYHTIDISCDRCTQPMICKSRQRMNEIRRAIDNNEERYAEGYRVLCESCWAAVQRERCYPQ